MRTETTSKYKYAIWNQTDKHWGLIVRSVGTQNIAAEESYPLVGQNSEYATPPNKGRILLEYQIIYIVRGEGYFQSTHFPKTKVTAGDVFMLFPEEWHMYGPNQETGWTEYWVDFRGSIMNDWTAKGFFDVHQPLFHVGIDDEMIHLLTRSMEVLNDQDICYQQLLAGYLVHMIGLITSRSRSQKLKSDDNLSQKIDKARILLQNSIEEEIKIPELARRVNLNYTSFRVAFKQYTGLTPIEYKNKIKIQRATDMLYNPENSLKSIAYALQFESQEYFSTFFKRMTGITPSEFRRVKKIK